MSFFRLHRALRAHLPAAPTQLVWSYYNAATREALPFLYVHERIVRDGMGALNERTARILRCVRVSKHAGAPLHSLVVPLCFRLYSAVHYGTATFERVGYMLEKVMLHGCDFNMMHASLCALYIHVASRHDVELNSHAVYGLLLALNRSDRWADRVHFIYHPGGGGGGGGGGAGKSVYSVHLYDVLLHAFVLLDRLREARVDVLVDGGVVRAIRARCLGGGLDHAHFFAHINMHHDMEWVTGQLNTILEIMHGDAGAGREAESVLAEFL